MAGNWFVLIGMVLAFAVAVFFLFRYLGRRVKPKQSTGRLIIYIILVQVVFWAMIFTLFYTYINLFPEHSIL